MYLQKYQLLRKQEKEEKERLAREYKEALKKEKREYAKARREATKQRRQEKFERKVLEKEYRNNNCHYFCYYNRIPNTINIKQ